MSTKLIAGAAAVVLLGTAMSAGLAQAQDRDRGPRGGGEGGPARAAPAERAAPQQSAPRVERSQPRAERAPERRAVERPQRVERQREQNVQRAERRQRDQQQRVERNQREQSQRAARQQREQTQRAERQQREQTQRAERQQREQKQNAERQQREQQQKSAEQRRNDQGKQTEGKQTERNQSGPQRVNQLQATNEQRKGVRDRIFRERGVDRISKRDFRQRVAVGVRIDRRHHRHLHRLTPAILAFAPIYAGYSYLVVDDEICIVDPATYYVVDVIPSTVEFAGGSSRPQLVLSAEDMRFIYASVPKDRPVDVRIRLALGAEIPGRVDLERFPGGVIDRVPQVDGYRYIVVEDDVVIVDPNDRAVALVITE